MIVFPGEKKDVLAEEGGEIFRRVLSKTRSLEDSIYALLLVLRGLMERHRILQKDAIILSLVDQDVRSFFIQGELASAGSIIGVSHLLRNKNE